MINDIVAQGHMIHDTVAQGHMIHDIVAQGSHEWWHHDPETVLFLNGFSITLLLINHSFVDIVPGELWNINPTKHLNACLTTKQVVQKK